jgi:hypothetical protein
MKTTVTTVLLGAFVALHATAAFASTNLNSSRSNVNKVAGQAATASVNLSGPSDTQTVFTAPATGSFYIQAFCADDVAGGVRLDIAGIGPIAVTGIHSSCEHFDLWVYVPQNADVTCSTSSSAPAGSYFCSITGTASK